MDVPVKTLKFVLTALSQMEKRPMAGLVIRSTMLAVDMLARNMV